MTDDAYASELLLLRAEVKSVAAESARLARRAIEDCSSAYERGKADGHADGLRAAARDLSARLVGLEGNATNAWEEEDARRLAEWKFRVTEAKKCREIVLALIPQPQDSPAAGTDLAPCSYCDGSGSIGQVSFGVGCDGPTSSVCSACNGKGKQP
ncbi:hypothetical protein LCGC14_1773240 [marine sediment metagenome]|uniref:Uncharacterized protein n=1 Tax=marine sediment metagenome TaxID=412755 RepID=A0A0F9GXP0_9ZZZZ